jgi:hypothetical protein
MIKKRSISAIISVVLLILVTSVLVAGFLSWSKTSAKDRLEVSTEQLQKVSNMDCIKYNLIVESCNYDSITGDIEVLLRNPTPIDFYDLSLTVQGKSQNSDNVLKLFGKFSNPINAGEIKKLKTNTDFTTINTDINVSQGEIIDPLNLKTFSLSTSTCPKKTIDLRKCAVELPSFKIDIVNIINFEKFRINTPVSFQTESIYQRGTVSCEWYHTISGGSQVRMNPSDSLCDLSYTFTTPGAYEIMVVANDDEGTSSDNIFIEVIDDFSSTIISPLDDVNYNIPKTIDLVSTYQNNIGNVTCDWGIKMTGMPSFTSFSTDCNTSESITVSDNYLIKLDTIDDFDNSNDSDTISLNLLEPLSSNATISRTLWNNNESITLNGSYQNNIGTASCEWLLNSNDVNTSIGTNCSSVSRTIASVGSYTVYYKVTDAGSGDVATDSENFQVVLPLTASFSLSKSVYSLSETINFSSSVSNSIGSLSYQWQYNRNETGWSNFGSTSSSTNNGFATGGTYSFRLSVTDASRPSGINQVYSNTVTGITISNPLAVSIGLPTSGTGFETSSSNNITFNSNVSYAVSGVSSYSWEYSTNQSTWNVFGTNSSSASTYFTTTGTKYIRVTVVDGAGRTATSPNSYNVVLSAPAVVLLNQTSFSNLTGWSTSGGAVGVNSGSVKLNQFWDPAGFFYQGLTTQGNLVLEGVVDLSSENDTSQAGLTFNYSTTNASYVCSITQDYGNDGLYLKYGNSELSSDSDGSWKVPAGNYNIKVEAFGSSKKCKYWPVGDSEPGWTLSVTHSTRNVGKWGGWVYVNGKVKSIKATSYG